MAKPQIADTFAPLLVLITNTINEITIVHFKRNFRSLSGRFIANNSAIQ